MTSGAPAEARSGLEPWERGDLPVPPDPRGLQWLGVVGPGVIMLGVAIGSGEFLLGPAVFVRHGPSLLWVTVVSVYFQTIFNTEVMRYTLATGEPICTGFMRTRPSSTVWAWVYTLFYFLHLGWPAWAATAAGAVFFLGARRLPSPDETYAIAVTLFLVCVALLLVGRRIERTLEILNWVLCVCILGGLLVLALLFAAPGTWASVALGYVGFDLANARFDFMPAGADFVLLAALVAYSGSGGVGNLTLSNWARDKGYGMGARAGYIPAAVGGQKVHLAHTGFTFAPDAEAMGRWRGWWRIVRADQWGIFFAGALLGMALPALLYLTFIPRGTDIRGAGMGAALAASMGAEAGQAYAALVGFLAAWLLFKVQLDNIEGLTRAVTDILWTGSRRLRAWRGGDVRAVYYSVLAVLVVWGLIALRLAQPAALLQIGANIAAFVLVFASLHVLYVNTTLLPPALRPPAWRRGMLVAMAVFYSIFLALSVSRMVRGA